jgi:hypothetical protein
MRAGVTPVEVTVVASDGPRYTIEQFVETTREFMAISKETMRKANGEGIEIELRGEAAQPQILKIDELKHINPQFARDWNRDEGFPGRSRNRSANEWDMSIANHLAWAGFTPQEICDALTYHRIRFGDFKQKYMREDYMRRTIGKALASVEAPDIYDSDEEESLEDAIDELTRQSKMVNPDPIRTASLFTEVLGGPEVKRLVQDGRDPEYVQYRLELADGSEVPLGGVDNLIEQSRFRKMFAVVTGHLFKRLKGAKWDDVIRALLSSAEVNDDDSRHAIVGAWLEGYLDYGLSTDRDAACQACDPFIAEDRVAVHAGNLGMWLRRNRGVRMKDTEIHQYLHAAGFERRSVSYTRDDGKRSMRSYWFAPVGGLTFMPEAV